ncbi:MAG: GNAT family N-acetyltransferase, partial [Candidatus Bathyarchaeota archaeon]|nr:GNAT family N-acetyltransferase [Candidatus Bathyarchaeota archaeon]
KRLLLKSFVPALVSKRYLKWMNDYEVIKYLESRFSPPASLDELREYVRNIDSDPNQLFFAIFHIKDDIHIGNIKIGPINRVHLHASVGIIIGERTYWGQGYATEAIEEITRYSFEKLNLNHLFAGCYNDNIGSKNAFLKAGWMLEGTQIGHYCFEGRFVNGLLFGKNKEK